MNRLSISDAAAWTGRFLRREWRLLVPVAGAFFAVPSLLLQLVAPNLRTGTGEVTALAPWMFWLVPGWLAALAGGLAIVAMALVPGISVAEALRVAGRRFVTFVLAFLVLFVVATMATGLLLMVLAFAGTLLGADALTLRSFGTVLAILVMLAITARILPLPVVVVAGELGPTAALRRAWSLTAGQSWRLLGAVTMLFATALIGSFAAQRAITVVAMLVGRAVGGEALLLSLAGVVIAAIGAAVSTAFYVLTAALYRQLAD